MPRPKNEKSRQAILDTAYIMVMSDGIGRLTIERVAKAAHVGKPTIYREWANTSELAMAAIMSQPLHVFKMPAVSGRDGLVQHLKDVIRAFSNTRGRQIMLALAAIKEENDLTSSFREQVILGSREIGRRLLEGEMESGNLVQGLAVETVLDMLYAPIFFRLLTDQNPIRLSIADEVVDTVYSGIGVME